MQTLVRPEFTWADLRALRCEQVVPGNADLESEEEEEGSLGGGELGVEPKPLQGGGDSTETGDRERETGAEGDGT